MPFPGKDLPGLTSDARAVFDAAVHAVQADRLLADASWDRLAPRPLDAYRRVVVAGIGKASMAMAGVVERALGDRVDGGMAVVAHGYAASLPGHLPPPRRVEVLEAGHPVPDAASVAAARRVLALADGCGPDDLFLVLLSGGGTSLCADFAGGVGRDIDLDDAREAYRLLLASGADIHAMNAVRKHLSRVGGGRLARAAAPADVLALAVSDVPGDDLSVIASGPTVPDPSTYADAVAVLHARDLWTRVPASVRRHLDAGRSDAGMETPKPDDPCFERVRTHLVGTNRDALTAAAQEAARRGYRPVVAASPVVGEARTVGAELAAVALRNDALRHDGPTCLLWGGETTVTLRGSGRGGRNQEVALAAALALDGAGRDVAFLSAGTDGVDGPTDAAGAWATPATLRDARAHGLDARAHLDDNDAYPFFARTGGLVRTGPTHTNVMDVLVALVR